MVVLGLPTAHAATLVVNQSAPACLITSDGNYSTIQAAINAANTGDAIRVCDGTYNENLDIVEEVDLQGFSKDPSKVFVNASNQGDDVIDIASNNVNISFFTIKTSNVRAINATNSERFNISHNIFSNISNTVLLFKGSDNGFFSYNTLNHVTGVSSSDILVQGSDFITFSDNIFLGIGNPSNCKAFAFIFSPQNTTLSNNTFLLTNYSEALLIQESTNGTRIYNNFFNISSGAFVTITNGPSLYFNTTQIIDNNVIGGPVRGGNVWSRQNGTGFSDTCSDTDRDGICDTSYTINPSIPYIDYSPLSYSIPFIVESTNAPSGIKDSNSLGISGNASGVIEISRVWIELPGANQSFGNTSNFTSYIDFSGTKNSTGGTWFRVWANNTLGQINKSQNYTFLIDSAIPHIVESTNAISSRRKISTLVYANASDDASINRIWIELPSGNQSFGNTSNFTSNIDFQNEQNNNNNTWYRIWANDTFGNINKSKNYTFTVSNVRVVNQSTNCTTGLSYHNTISDAVGNSTGGENIEVCQGTYNENVNITVRVNLRGFQRDSSKVFINASTKTDPAIELHIGSINISFLTIGGTTGGADPGIYVPGGSLGGGNANISYNTFQDISNADGVLVEANGVTIFKNTFNNDVIGNFAAIRGYISATGAISNLNIQSNTINIPTSNSFERISLDGCTDCLISNNSFLDGLGDNSAFLMDLSECGNLIIQNNTFKVSNFSYVVGLRRSQNVIIANNIFNISNGLFYDTTDGAKPGIVSFNFSKTNDINLLGGPYVGGNFWGFQNGTGFSYDCTDSNGDGICDSPYVIINATNTDYLPLTTDQTIPFLVESSNVPTGVWTSNSLPISANASDHWGISRVWIELPGANQSFGNTSNFTSYIDFSGVKNSTGGTWYRVWANDTLGQVNFSNNYTFMIDTDIPFLVESTNAPTGIRNTNSIPISANASDSAGISRIWIELLGSNQSFGNTSNFTSTIDFSSFKNSTGGTWYRIWANDTIGQVNFSKNYTFLIDTEAPFIVESTNAPTGTRGTYVLPISANTSDVLGVSRVWIELPGANQSFGNTSNFTSRIDFYNFQNSTGGTWFRIWANDSAGNLNKSKNHTFMFDSVVRVEIQNPDNGTNHSTTRFTFNTSQQNVSLAYSTNGDLVWSSRFEDNGSVDYSGYGNDGTLISGAVKAKGKFGDGVSFNAINSTVTLPFTPINGTEFTITTWAKIDGAGGGSLTYNSLFTQRDSNNGAGDVQIYLCGDAAPLGNNVSFIVRSTTGGLQTLSTNRSPYGEWHQYTGMVNSTHIALFIDGILKGIALNLQTGNYWQGVDVVDIGRFRINQTILGDLNGTLDEMRIYNRSLSATEISYIYNVSVGRVNNISFISHDLSDGTNTLNLTGIDEIGSINSSSVQFTVDSTNPSVSSVTIPNPTLKQGETTNITVNVTDGGPGVMDYVIFQNKLIGRNFTMVGSGEGIYYYVFSSERIGTHTFLIWANDTFGNINNTEGGSIVVTESKGGGGSGGVSGGSSGGPAVQLRFCDLEDKFIKPEDWSSERCDIDISPRIIEGRIVFFGEDTVDSVSHIGYCLLFFGGSPGCRESIVTQGEPVKIIGGLWDSLATVLPEDYSWSIQEDNTITLLDTHEVNFEHIFNKTGNFTLLMEVNDSLGNIWIANFSFMVVEGDMNATEKNETPKYLVEDYIIPLGKVVLDKLDNETLPNLVNLTGEIKEKTVDWYSKNKDLLGGVGVLTIFMGMIWLGRKPKKSFQ
jgi:hypothetical protein